MKKVDLSLIIDLKVIQISRKKGNFIKKKKVMSKKLYSLDNLKSQKKIKYVFFKRKILKG